VNMVLNIAALCFPLPLFFLDFAEQDAATPRKCPRGAAGRQGIAFMQKRG